MIIFVIVYKVSRIVITWRFYISQTEKDLFYILNYESTLRVFFIRPYKYNYENVKN